MHPPDAAPSPAALRRAALQRHFWRSTLALTVALLFVWFLVSVVVTWFARELSFDFFGWPFSFWMAAQGGLVVFCLIVFFYARTMNRLDELHAAALAQCAAEEAAEPQAAGAPSSGASSG
ncbi:DUF4212 domain-containing protein [Roseateles sp. BYS180W]|uniref:DUF4212 domain-containing protein n=1 Tax=Roseateles rivi TaxID=3299028 RepID=A0ABW7FSF5_9BURK